MDDRLKRDVVLDIIRRYRQEFSLVAWNVQRGLHADPHLYRMALRAFGNWTGALKSASASEPQIWISHLPMVHRYPTRSSIVTAIRRRFDDGLPLNMTDIVAGPQSDRALYSCALRVMGGWAKALRAAGIISKNEQRYRKRRETGQPLNLQAVQHSEHLLYKRAKTLCGSWRQAIVKAGIAYTSVALPTGPPSRYPTAESVLEAIRSRQARGLPLNWVGLEEGPSRDVTLIKRGKKFFGTWRAAIKAAGIPYRSVCRVYLGRMTRKQIVARIRKRAARHQALSAHAVRRGTHRDFVLWRQASIVFGHWHDALHVAGVIPSNMAIAARKRSNRG